MADPVRSYRLPEEAPWVDRATLALWKEWDAWLRPLLAAAIVMIAVHILLAFVSGIVGPWDVNLRYLTRWGPEPSATTFVIGLPSFVIFGPSDLAAGLPSTQALGWSVSWQGTASIAGALAVWPVLRRHRRPAALGAVAGLVAVLTRLAAGRLFTWTPFGAAAGILWNSLAVLVLWSTPMFGAVVGWRIASRRRRSDSVVRDARSLGGD